PEGGLLPATWDYKVALHFAHRAMAAVIGVMILIYGHFLWREKSLIPPLRAASLLLVGLVAGQIYLGAQIIWTGRSVAMTTGHVILGALTLAVTFGVAFSTQRGSIERARP
nr:COX15/CtaA family protein [Lacunisphaera sp.]